MLTPPAPGEAAVLTRGIATTLPLRREGREKLTGEALYTDDLVFPGAWYGATIRSTMNATFWTASMMKKRPWPQSGRRLTTSSIRPPIMCIS